MGPTVYVAIAYRWGKSNNHWYLLCGGVDLEKICEQAQNEVSYRGGKYSVAVYETLQDMEKDQKMVAYFPGCHGEKFPTLDYRVKAEEEIGFDCMWTVEHGNPSLTSKEKIEIPEWLKDLVEKKLKFWKTVYGGCNRVYEKSLLKDD